MRVAVTAGASAGLGWVESLAACFLAAGVDEAEVDEGEVDKGEVDEV